MAQVRGGWKAVQLLSGWSRTQLKVTHPLCLYNGTLETSHLFERLQLQNILCIEILWDKVKPRAPPFI